MTQKPVLVFADGTQPEWHAYTGLVLSASAITVDADGNTCAHPVPSQFFPDGFTFYGLDGFGGMEPICDVSMANIDQLPKIIEAIRDASQLHITIVGAHIYI